MLKVKYRIQGIPLGFVTLYVYMKRTRLLIYPHSMHTACREPLITGGRYRVEDEQITASSVLSQSYTPHEARLGGMSWCAEEGMGDGAWIQVDFIVDVIIQELRIGGINQFYITQFTIEHGPNSDQLSSILQENSTEPMVFTRPDSPDVSTTVLPTPLTTRVLRIVSVVHSGSEPCVCLEVLGCALFPGKFITYYSLGCALSPWKHNYTPCVHEAGYRVLGVHVCVCVCVYGQKNFVV